MTRPHAPSHNPSHGDDALRRFGRGDRAVAGTDDPAALAERDGRVVAVGGRQDMERIAGAGAARLDVRGATILPGLVDTHPHVLHFGVFSFPLVDLADARSHDDIVERVRARAAITPPGEWIMTTPVGEPHYFVRRSWKDLAEDRSVLDRATSSFSIMCSRGGGFTETS